MIVRGGLIGHGLGGRAFHEPLMRAARRIDLRAIATSRSTPDPAALIADPDIDLIVISTPNHSHHPLAKAAIEAGKHVVIDKPFTVTIDEADELIALARARGRILTVFHNRRWDGDFMTVRDIIASGRLGQVIRYEAHWDRFRPAIKPGWKEEAGPGTGVLGDLGPHLIDQTLLLFGAPDAISGDLEKQRAGTAVEDYFAIQLRYGRMRAILTSSLLSAAPRPRFALYGTEGAFVKYGLDPQEPQAQAGMAPDDPAFGVEDPAWHGILTLADGTTERVPTARGHYLAYYDAVAAAILDGAPVPVDPTDARAGLDVIARVRADAGARTPAGAAPAA